MLENNEKMNSTIDEVESSPEDNKPVEAELSTEAEMERTQESVERSDLETSSQEDVNEAVEEIAETPVSEVVQEEADEIPFEKEPSQKEESTSSTTAFTKPMAAVPSPAQVVKETARKTNRKKPKGFMDYVKYMHFLLFPVVILYYELVLRLVSGAHFSSVFYPVIFGIGAGCLLAALTAF
ncbi:MAG: hypothetical protein ACSW8B_06220, partial [bacterium]